MKRYYYLCVFLCLVGFMVWYVPFTGFGEPPLTAAGVYSIINPWSDTAVLADRIDSKEYFVTLVVVCSAAENFPRRQAIRQTWGGTLDGKSAGLAKVIFLLGRPFNTSQAEIENEFSFYGDIIQEDFLDTYYNLTLKSVFMLKQFIEYYTFAQFLLKADDDIIVNLDNLFDFIRGLENGENVLVGHRHDSASPLRDGKWFISYLTYPYPLYPNYLSGACYLMDRIVAQKLYYTTLDMDGAFHFEDVFITGFVAEKANVERQHALEFAIGADVGRDCDASNPKYIAGGHRITPENLTRAWRERDPLIGICFDA